MNIKYATTQSTITINPEAKANRYRILSTLLSIPPCKTNYEDNNPNNNKQNTRQNQPLLYTTLIKPILQNPKTLP
jgi:hypothetical protein